MIIDRMIALGFDLINLILDGLKIPELSLNLSVLNPFLDVVSNVAYFFPWQYLIPIFGFLVGLQLLRITISLIKLVTHILPFF